MNHFIFLCRKFHLTYASESEQERLGEAVVKSMGIINPFCLGDFPYHGIPDPKESPHEVTVFPISELEERRNSFEIPIPLLEPTVENIKAMYSITKASIYCSSK